jgi:hypothetical protein
MSLIKKSFPIVYIRNLSIGVYIKKIATNIITGKNLRVVYNYISNTPTITVTKTLSAQ